MSLYFSRLILNPRSRQVRAELEDPYQMHRTLSKAFGDDKSSWQEARVLFRVDEVGGMPWVLVQSQMAPDWSRLTVSEDYLKAQPETKEINPCFHSGQKLVFRLLANPTKKSKSEGKRLGLVKEEEQIRWLNRKGELHGFEVCSVALVPFGKLKSKITKDDKECEATFFAVRFDGLLRVTNPESFAKAIRHGVGSAKGLGFGLLSVAPAGRC